MLLFYILLLFDIFWFDILLWLLYELNILELVELICGYIEYLLIDLNIYELLLLLIISDLLLCYSIIIWLNGFINNFYLFDDCLIKFELFIWWILFN
jgi:hypothetical protein